MLNKVKMREPLREQLKKKLSMSDGIDFNMWARDTNPTKEEMVAWLERRV